MRNRLNRLLHKEGFLGNREIDAITSHLAGESVMISIGIIAKKG